MQCSQHHAPELSGPRQQVSSPTHQILHRRPLRQLSRRSERQRSHLQAVATAQNEEVASLLRSALSSTRSETTLTQRDCIVSLKASGCESAYSQVAFSRHRWSAGVPQRHWTQQHRGGLESAGRGHQPLQLVQETGSAQGQVPSRGVHCGCEYPVQHRGHVFSAWLLQARRLSVDDIRPVVEFLRHQCSLDSARVCKVGLHCQIRLPSWQPSSVES